MRKHYLSQLAHVELITPTPEESAKFFKEIIGLEETAREGQSVYLRAWGDHFHHSLKLTEGPRAELGHVGWRADSAGALQAAAEFLESAGYKEGWIDGDLGHGPAYRFRTPGNHMQEIFWEVEWYQADPENKTALKNLPQKRGTRGLAVQRLDHVNMMTDSVPPCRELFQQLGFKWHESIIEDGTETELGSWLAVTNLSHDVAFMRDQTGSKGRFNHIAYYHETREEVLRSADILRDNGYEIESGPSKHGISQAFFLYVIEPGGHRVEVYSGTYLNFAPDWGPVKWYVSEKPDVWFGAELAASVKSYATPPIDTETGVA